MSSFVLKSCLKFSRTFSGITTAKQLSEKLYKDKFYDLIVIGGGIVGMCSAREILLRNPKLRVAVLEKERKLAAHQTGHNAGVIHAGVYYEPKSVKAKLCVEGLKLIHKYLNKKEVPYKSCGKLIVATDAQEANWLLNLFERALQNDVPDLKLLNSAQIKEIEPKCCGVSAIWSPHSGVVDWSLVTQHFGNDFKEFGGHIYLNYKVKQFIQTTNGNVLVCGKKFEQKLCARFVLTCAGLQADKLAALTGCAVSPRILPVRGEYSLLAKTKRHLVHTNVYAVPKPGQPFWGIHLTPRMDGSVLLGPYAVLALKREGYRSNEIDFHHLYNIFSYAGFAKMFIKNFNFGFAEMLKSSFKTFKVQELQKYFPEIQQMHVLPGPTGVRAQAIDNAGNLIDDFLFERGISPKQVLHVRSVPSPGATNCMAFAKIVADKVQEEFGVEKLKVAVESNPPSMLQIY